jgi:hypothetical protein
MPWSLPGLDGEFHPLDRVWVTTRKIPRDPKAGMESYASGSLMGLMENIRIRGLITLMRTMLGISIPMLLLKICGYCMLMACLLRRLRRGR